MSIRPQMIEKPVPAGGKAIWTCVDGFLQGPLRIEITASGQWSFSNWAGQCGPDGVRSPLIDADKLINKKAPVGALVAKLGGGIAGVDDGDLFVVGSFGVIVIGKDKCGPLYLAINDDPNQFGDNAGEVDAVVRIYDYEPPEA